MVMALGCGAVGHTALSVVGLVVINIATRPVMDMTAITNHESPPGGGRGRLLHEGDAAQSATSPSRGGYSLMPASHCNHHSPCASPCSHGESIPTHG